MLYFFCLKPLKFVCVLHLTAHLPSQFKLAIFQILSGHMGLVVVYWAVQSRNVPVFDLLFTEFGEMHQLLSK